MAWAIAPAVSGRGTCPQGSLEARVTAEAAVGGSRRGYGRGFGSRHGFGFGGARRFNPADDVDLGVDPRNSVLPAESAVTRLLVEQIARLKDQVHALEARLAGPEPKE